MNHRRQDATHRPSFTRQLANRALLLVLGSSLGCATNFMDGPPRPPANWQANRSVPAAQPAPPLTAPDATTVGSEIVPVAFYPNGTAANPAPVPGLPMNTTAHFTPATPRLPHEPTLGQAYPVMEVTGDAMAYRYPDEYLFDGGDRGMAVHYSAGQRRGVETEDTIAEYSDHTGQRHVRASNPVAIYAPRFAAVRTMSGPEEGVAVDRLAMSRDAYPGAGFAGQVTLATSNRRSKASGMRTRERGSEVDTVDATIAMRANKRPAGNVFVLKALKRRQLQADGRFDHTHEAWLASRIRKAAGWSDKAYPVVQAVTAAAVEVQASFRPQQHVGIDEEQAKGALRIIKMADVDSAMPGDLITFTIEFQNIGNKELHNVRIIDNLTPRLEYVEDSGASDVPGRIVVNDNGQGSKILQFELEGQIEGGAKGTVRFQARVR